VITSTCVLVIGVVLVIVLGLDGKTHLRKAALTGFQLPTIHPLGWDSRRSKC
jgi:hypothetical protein